MNKFMRLVSFVVAGFVFFQVSAFADAIEGRVQFASSRALDVIVYDAQGRPYPNVLHLKADNRTTVSGAPSVSSLRPDDAIGADVSQEETGVWRVDHVTLFQQMNAQPATKAPSASLRDVLGNPMVKGALIGAATGAIASSASGGKAGKGALVGAGVGAAAGLLGQMFGGGSSQSSDSDNR